MMTTTTITAILLILKARLGCSYYTSPGKCKRLYTSLLSPIEPVHYQKSFYTHYLPLRKDKPFCRDGMSLRMAIVGPVRYSSEDWVDCIATLPSSRILARTKYYILFIIFWTTLLSMLFQTKRMMFTLPVSVHSILGSALGLLLVFRTNASYDRFWEARKSWGSVIIACREIAKLAYGHLDKAYHRRIAGMLVSFTIALKQHLQGDRIDSDFNPFLEDDDFVRTLQSKRNRPLFLLRALDRLIMDALTDYYKKKGREDLVFQPKYIEKGFFDCCLSLSTQLGCCERIVKQPVPLSYSRHTSRFLSLYMLTLPWSLLPVLGYMAIPVVTAICWSFVSILEIGHFIEEPFDKKTQLIPLNQLVSVIRSDVSELMEGILDDPAIAVKEDLMLQETINNSRRRRDDDFFAYYCNLPNQVTHDSNSS